MNEQNHHYLASCISGWGTGSTLNKAVHNCTYNGVRKGLGHGKHVLDIYVWHVPSPDEGSSYDIRNFAPQVEGAHLVGLFQVKKGELTLPDHDEFEAATLPAKETA